MTNQDQIIQEADLVLANKFRFTDKWAMEPCPDIYEFEDEIQWTYAFKEDPEWTYMLNRHQYFITLGRAYKITSDPRYLEGFERMILHWIHNNPLMESLKSTTWRSIEAGIRCDYWLDALAYFEDDLTESTLDLIYGSLHEHGAYLFKLQDPDIIHSNWVIIQNAGLYKLSLKCPFFSDSDLWRPIAIQQLHASLEIQLYEDGMHWEQSMTYHCEIILCLIKSLLTAEACGISKDQGLMNALSHATQALISVLSPNNDLPVKGDSDAMDVSGLVTLAAYVLDWPSLPLDHYLVDDEFIDHVDYERLEKIELTPQARPTHSSSLPHSGYHIMLSESRGIKNQLVFTTGDIGGGHGHMDLFHYDVYYQNRPVLVDSGRFTYADHMPERKAFKLPQAHNTVMVDQTPFSQYGNTWLYHKVTRSLYQHFQTQPIFDYAEAAHDGYMDLNDPVLHTRGILFLKPSLYLIIDTLRCRKQHRINRFYNMANSDGSLDEQGLLFENNIRITPLMTDRFWIENQVISKRYNEKSPSIRMIDETTIEGTQQLLTLIYPKDTHLHWETLTITDRWGSNLDSSHGYALRLSLPKENFIILDTSLDPSQNNHYKVDGRWLLGRKKLIHQIDGQTNLYNYH